jgi:hypothetical protein
MVMMSFRHDRARRATASLALALFLLGTHYCLVGSVASRFGAHISCMAPAAASAGSCHSAPVSSHCAHATAPASKSGSAPVRAATPPCCVALAPVLATSLVKIPADALAPVLPASPAANEAAPVLTAWLGLRVTRDTGPPAALHPRAPLSPRAPPLA